MSGTTIQLLHLPGCPLVARVRETLRLALSQSGISAPVEELVGDYPSPTLLIAGRDVTGNPLAPHRACRLDLPTEEQILRALRATTSRRTTKAQLED